MPPETRIGDLVRRQWPGIRFCALYALFTVLVFAALYAAQRVVIDPLNRHFAWLSQTLLGFFGAATTSSGAVVALHGFAVEIKNNCNAAYEIGLYTAAVWAYPASHRDHLIGTLAGGAVLYAVNLLRILTLLALGLLDRAWFEAAHLYAWQALFLLVVATCWLGWVSRVRPRA